MWLLKFDFEIGNWVDIKHQALATLSNLKEKRKDKTDLDKELLLLTVDEAKLQRDVTRKFFDEDQLRYKQAGNHNESNRKEI